MHGAMIKIFPLNLVLKHVLLS